jgi:butyrate kinase
MHDENIIDVRDVVDGDCVMRVERCGSMFRRRVLRGCMARTTGKEQVVEGSVEAERRQRVRGWQEGCVRTGCA